ncbi:MAG: YfhO family protein, partial [Chloroflexota bacterium]
LNEYTITQVAGIPLLINLAWIPVVLALVERALQRNSVGYALGAAAALTMQLFNGWLHGLYVTAFALLATFLWHGATRTIESRNWRPLLQATGLMALMGGAWAALGAALLLPALEFTSLSNYLMDRGLERAGGEGNVTVLAILGIGGSEGHGVYLGALGLFLLLLGTLHGGDRQRVWLYLLLGGFALLAAFGTKAPLYAHLYQWLPGFKTFHTPGRFMVLYLLSASALAAYGADTLLKGITRRQLLTVLGLALLLLAPFYYTMSRMFAPEAFGLLVNNLIHWSEGPYLRAENAQHILFSGLAAALFLLALASGRLPGKPAYGIAILILVADFFLLRGLGGQYFVPPPEIHRSTDLGSRLTLESGNQEPFRSMGYARNGTMHFLSDFPNNLVPFLAPPNLAMVYGTEDVQGYNPLQLRRYAQYLSAVNGGPEDYHWALVYNLQSRLLDLLNLRYVALRGDESRASNVTVATALNLETDKQSLTVPARGILASGLRVHSYLGHSADMADGQAAARLRVTDASGRAWSFDLRAGIETAEWAYDRPDVRSRVQHQRATVSMTWNLPTPVHTYVADLTFPQPMEVREVTLERVQPDIFIVVPEVAVVPVQPVLRYELVDDSQGTQLYRNNLALPRALLVPRAEVVQDPAVVLQRLQRDNFDPKQEVILEGPGLPKEQGAGPDVGEVISLSRSNNTLRLQVRAASYGFLLLNELSYPGWNAYLDGQRIRVWRANYLFRAVEVPSGEHEVEFRFEPDSLKLGLALCLPTVALLLAAAVYRLKTRQHRKEGTVR